MASTNNYATNTETDFSLTVSLGDWLVTFPLTAIPVVGFVLLCVWAFGRQTLPGKANWAKATLLLYVLGLVIGLSFVVLTMLAKPANQVQVVGSSYKAVP